VFEQGDRTQPAFIDTMLAMSTQSEIFKRRFKIHSITPLSKAQVKMFDAADLMAWEVTHYIPTALGMNSRPMSQTLRKIAHGVSLAAEYIEIDKLRQMATRMAQGGTPERIAAVKKMFGLRYGRW
jgi:hypothetical protein